jgi:hypothetical protein
VDEVAWCVRARVLGIDTECDDNLREAPSATFVRAVVLIRRA